MALLEDKIDLLNQATLKSLNVIDYRAIIRNFTESGIKILSADFGFVWWKLENPEGYKLIYETQSLPFKPASPRKRGNNHKAERTRNPYFVERVKKHRLKKYNVSVYLKSFVIIPIIFRRKSYGNVVICFKHRRYFSQEDKILCKTLGNALAQAITIHQLYFNLKDFKNRLDRTLDSVIIFDPVNFKIEYANLGAVSKLGFSHSELMKKTFFDILTKAEQEKFKKSATSLIFRKRDSLTLETALKTKGGKVVPVELFLQLSGSLKGPRKFLSIVHDISERKKNEAEAKRLLKQKDEFLSIASHELKTPITTIKGFTQLIEDGLSKTDNSIRYYFEKINFQVDKLTRLVNDLLDVSRVETGKLKFRRGVFELRETIESLANDLQVGITSHRIVVKLRGRFWIYGDADRIVQVLINLVNNAVKYSPDARKVLISLSKRGKYAKVSVEDFGVGIDRKNRKKVFERFFQPKSRVQTFPGLGLGLYISSSIIKFHKGEIWCEGKKPPGSIFSFILPYKKWQAEK